MSKAPSVGETTENGITMSETVKYDKPDQMVSWYKASDYEYTVVIWDIPGNCSILEQFSTDQEESLGIYLNLAFGISF